MEAREFVTSDTHGCAERLIDCLDQAKFNYQKDKLIHLGDIVDRGPDSKGVVDLLLSITNLISIKGNHDHWWLQYLVMRHGAPHIHSHMTQGGVATVESYINKVTGGLEVPRQHEEFFRKQLIHYTDEQNRFFTHAGYDRMEKVENQEDTVFAWDREMMKDAMLLREGQPYPDVNNFKRVFVGHNATTYWSIEEAGQYSKDGVLPILLKIDEQHTQRCDKPIYKANIVDVDTGGCYGGKISLLDITDDNNHILYQG